jgi:hypothetical protein
VVIKVLFVILILSTAALVGVGLAIHFRVKRHLREQNTEPHGTSPPESKGGAELPPGRNADTID